MKKFDVLTQIHVVPCDILLAQKCCAILTRKRAMGRDFYDVLFLLGKAKPNLKYLAAKLNIHSFSELTQKLITHCKGLNFKQLSEDVRPFLFHADDAGKILLFPEVINAAFE